MGLRARLVGLSWVGLRCGVLLWRYEGLCSSGSGRSSHRKDPQNLKSRWIGIQRLRGGISYLLCT